MADIIEEENIFAGVEQVTEQYAEPDRFEEDFSEDMASAFRLTANGAMLFADQKYQIPGNDVDPEFKHNSPQVQKLYADYKVDPIKQTDFYDSVNEPNLVARLERYQLRQQDKARLQEEQPIAQYPIMMATSLADLPSMLAMPLGYKVLGGVKMLKEATRTNNAIKSAMTVTVANTASEAMLQTSSDDYNPDELQAVALMSGLIGGGLGTLLPTARANPKFADKDGLTPFDKVNMELQGLSKTTEKDLKFHADMLNGTDDFAHIDDGFRGRIESFAGKFTWSPIAKMYKSKNPLVVGVANASEQTPLALSSGGQLQTGSPIKATNTKMNLNGLYSKFMRQTGEHYKKAQIDNPGIELPNYMKQLGDDYRLRLKNLEDDAVQKFSEVHTDELTLVDEYKTNVGEPPMKIIDDVDEAGNPIKSEVLDTELMEENLINAYMKQREIDSPIPDNLKPVRDFYEQYQKFGEEVGHSSFTGRNGRAYIGRMFDKEHIEELGFEKASDQMFEALMASSRNKLTISKMIRDGASDEEITKLFRKEAEGAVNKIMHSSIYTDLDFKSVTSTSALKKRRLHLDEQVAGDLIIRDVGNIAEGYNHKISGKLAIKKHLGIETQEDIVALNNRIEAMGRELGHTPAEITKDLKNVKIMLDSLTGTRGLATDPNSWLESFSRRFQKFNYVTLGGEFAINTLGEVGNAVGTNGLKVFSHFVPAVKETINMYKRRPLKSTTNDLLGMGLIEQIYRSNRVQRYDALDTIHSKGKADAVLDRWTNKMSDLSGLNFVTTALEMMVHSSTLNDLSDLAKATKLTKSQSKRLARLGLTTDDLNKFREQNRIEYDDNGHLVNYNFDKWTDIGFVDKIRAVVQNNVNEAVLQGDITRLPAFATTGNPLAKLALQFMRFPIQAHEFILLKTLDEMDARKVVGMATTIGVMGSFYSLREQALIQAGFMKEENQKYTWDEDGFANMAQRLGTKLPQLGVGYTVADMANKLFNPDAKTYGEDPISTFSGLGKRVNDVVKFGKDVIEDGEFTDANQRAMHYWLPFYNLFYIKPLTDMITEGETK